jgi:hypothetical protein
MPLFPALWKSPLLRRQVLSLISVARMSSLAPSGHSETVTFLSFNDVYECSPRSGYGGLAGLTTLIREEKVCGQIAGGVRAHCLIVPRCRQK